MFINVTRHGANRSLRLRPEAIAYLDEAVDGCAIRLIGGDTLRVRESETEVEALLAASLKRSQPRRNGQ